MRSRGSLVGVRGEREFDRVLATVLFTDIVGSTAKRRKLGDRRGGAASSVTTRVVRAILARFRGHEVDTAGDGFFATFDGPARAVRCAMAIVDAVRPLGIEVRAGVHTGEVETIDGKPAGMAVQIGARVGGARRTVRGARVADGARTSRPARVSRSRTPASTS